MYLASSARTRIRQLSLTSMAFRDAQFLDRFMRFPDV